MAWEQDHRSGRERWLRDATAAAGTRGNEAAQLLMGQGKGSRHAPVDKLPIDRKLHFHVEESKSTEGKRAKRQRQWTSDHIFAEPQCGQATPATLAAHSLCVQMKHRRSFSLWESLWIWAYNVNCSSISSNRGVNNLSLCLMPGVVGGCGWG